LSIVCPLSLFLRPGEEGCADYQEHYRQGRDGGKIYYSSRSTSDGSVKYAPLSFGEYKAIAYCYDETGKMVSSVNKTFTVG
jgi:hypothetical protein